MVYTFFDKKSTGTGFKKLKNTAELSALARSSSILADEHHKPIIRKFNKRKVYSQFKDNIWGVDLADMQSLNRKNKGIKYLLYAIDLYSKYAFVIPLKDKKGISVVNAFDKTIKQSNKKKQIKYGQIKENNFLIMFLKNGCQIMILICIQRIMKVNQ